MYNRILVPTDGSELSDKALEAAADFARLWVPLLSSLPLLSLTAIPISLSTDLKVLINTIPELKKWSGTTGNRSRTG